MIFDVIKVSPFMTWYMHFKYSLGLDETHSRLLYIACHIKQQPEPS